MVCQNWNWFDKEERHMTIYIVEGISRDGGGEICWNVKAFYNEPEAEDWANKAGIRAQELVETRPWTYARFSELLGHYQKNEFDPHMQIFDDLPPTYIVSDLKLV